MLKIGQTIYRKRQQEREGKDQTELLLLEDGKTGDYKELLMEESLGRLYFPRSFHKQVDMM
jgi:hypothetical protein